MTDKKKNIKQSFRVLNFNEAYKPPKMKYNKRLNIVEWGDENKFPTYIHEVYNHYGSSVHKNIINKKCKLISGKGFKELESEELQDFIKEHSLENEVTKATLDYELYNGYAFEIVWNNEGTALTSFKHIPIHKLRIGIQDENYNYPHMWYCNNWSNHRKEEVEMIRNYNPLIKQGKQILCHFEYNPGSDELYPIPGYSTSLNWIELDYQISVFHLNQAKQGYAPSFLLNFGTGIPTEEEMDEFAKQFDKKYSSTENAGKVIITYSEGKEQAPTIEAIELNDSDERFITLSEQVEGQIVAGAEIPPQLIILEPGKLGSSSERRELLTEFQQSYVTPRQVKLEGSINTLLSHAGFTEEVELETYIDDEAPKSSDKEADSRASLRASLKGVQGILKIQESVMGGLTSRESAIGLLELVYGYTNEEANLLLKDAGDGSNANMKSISDDLSEDIQNQIDDIKDKL